MQVSPTAALRIASVFGEGEWAVVRLTDINELPYPGVRVQAVASDGSEVTPNAAVTDASGLAGFRWIPGAGTQLRITVEGAPDIAPVIMSGSSEVQTGVE